MILSQPNSDYETKAWGCRTGCEGRFCGEDGTPKCPLLAQRDFIKSIVGAGMAWPVAARAQQGERMRRIGVLSSVAEEAES